jgi:hypothetical protein
MGWHRSRVRHDEPESVRCGQAAAVITGAKSPAKPPVVMSKVCITLFGRSL